MKTYVTIVFFFLIAFTIQAQIPESFQYQALIRNNGGHPVKDQNVVIRISILEGSVDGVSVYSEKHQVTTNDFGTVGLHIGEGEILTGEFASIGWGNNIHFVKVEIDYDNNNNFVHAGTSQLLSVPYALYAKASGSEKWQVEGDNIYYENGKVGIGTSAPLETLHVNGNLRGNQNGAVRIKSSFGYLDVGPKNPDYAHFYTDMPYGFYFGGAVTVRDQLIGYREGDLHISTQSSADYQPVKRISILNNNGYVGIGNASPAYNLDVNGSVNATSFYLNGEPFTGESAWTSGGSGSLYYSAGKVGIGTDTPQEALHINGNLRGDQNGAVRIKSSFGYLDVGPKNPDYAHFYTDMPYGFYFGGRVTVREHLIGYRENDFHISTQSNLDFQPVPRISIMNSNGYVGIGTTTPKSQLQIESGDIFINDASSGVIMKSPNNQCWKMTVDNSGNPVFQSVTCPE